MHEFEFPYPSIDVGPCAWCLTRCSCFVRDIGNLANSHTRMSDCSAGFSTLALSLVALLHLDTSKSTAQHHSDDKDSTLSWSASFYPQPLLNWQRKSTKGLAIDFPTLNTLGFVCYTISASCFLYSPLIRRQYAARHPLSPEPTTRINDLVFGVHAVVLSSLTYSQFFPTLWKFEVSPRQRASRPVLGVFWGCIAAVLLLTLAVVCLGGSQQLDPHAWSWIDVVSVGGKGTRSPSR